MSRPETALYAYQHGWQAAIDLCIAIEQTINEKDRANNRSKTPLGFARAVYETNHKEENR